MDWTLPFHWIKGDGYCLVPGWGAHRSPQASSRERAVESASQMVLANRGQRWPSVVVYPMALPGLALDLVALDLESDSRLVHLTFDTQEANTTFVVGFGRGDVPRPMRYRVVSSGVAGRNLAQAALRENLQYDWAIVTTMADRTGLSGRIGGDQALYWVKRRLDGSITTEHRTTRTQFSNLQQVTQRAQLSMGT